jgi:hypothetical protein
MSKAKVESPQTRGHRTRRLSNGEDGAKSTALRLGRRGRGVVGVNAKQQLTDAFERMGGVTALVKWGKSNRTEFYRLWARLIPKEDNVTVNTLTIEDVLAGLDAAAQQTEELNRMDEAAHMLGYERPTGTELA